MVKQSPYQKLKEEVRQLREKVEMSELFIEYLRRDIEVYNSNRFTASSAVHKVWDLIEIFRKNPYEIYRKAACLEEIDKLTGRIK